jgi:hypothetical protein
MSDTSNEWILNSINIRQDSHWLWADISLKRLEHHAESMSVTIEWSLGWQEQADIKPQSLADISLFDDIEHRLAKRGINIRLHRE